MSASGRFAAMTGQLLARKGEARPVDSPTSGLAIERREVVRNLDSTTFGWRAHKVSEHSRFSAASPSQRKRHAISLSVTDGEFEKLGLVAVKKRMNRQQLLRLAVDHYLRELDQEYRSECRCISADACCGSSAD
jgi:hypothetical protein